MIARIREALKGIVAGLSFYEKGNLLFAVLLVATLVSCGGGGSTSTTDSGSTTLPSTTQGKVGGTTVATAMGDSAKSTGTGAGSSLSSAKPISDAVATVLQAATFNTSTNTLSFTNHSVAGGGSMDGSYTFSSTTPTSPNSTIRYTVTGGTATITFSNSTVSTTVEGTTYSNLKMNGNMSQSLSGYFDIALVNSVPSTISFAMTSTPVVTSMTVKGTNVDVTITGSDLSVSLTGSGTVGSDPTQTCSGTVNWRTSDGTTGTCTVNSACNSCV